MKTLVIVLRSFWNASDINSTNGKKLIGTPRIRRPDLGVRKPGKNGIN
jgi:hypothetical protein